MTRHLLSSMRVSVVILIFGLGNFIPAVEQPITVATHLDTTIATIGDQIHYTVRLSYPPGTSFQLPALEGKLDKCEILQQHLTEPKRKGELLQQEWQLVLAVFDTGMITIPALEISAKKAADTTQTYNFVTEPQKIRVYSVLAPDARELKDIKPPFRLPAAIPWRWLIFFGIVAAAVGGSWWYFREWQRRHPPVVLNEAYLDPPHVVALQRLQALLNELPDSAVEIRPRFFTLSEILRAYLERRYFIRALEMATSEIQFVLPELEIDPQQGAFLVELLQDIDFVKYTGTSPAKEYFVQCTQRARQLIEATKQESFLRRTM